jgi:hypothetical protein
MVDVLSDVLGRTVPVRFDPDALDPAIVRAHDRINVVGQPAGPEVMRALGLPVTDFRTWADTHLGDLAR